MRLWRHKTSWKLESLTILTDDEEDSFKGENAVIKIVPLWKWLLQF